MLWIIASLVLWGFLHSWTASLSFKAFFEKIFGAGVMRFYRLSYNIFALFTFLPILWLARILPDRTLYSIPAPWMYAMLFGQLLAAVGEVVGVLSTDVWEFAGLRQLVSHPHLKDGKLIVDGLYKYIRHPLYTFGLLFIWLTPVMTQNMLTVYIGATIYIVIGAYFEERKLCREFGDEYAAYQARTPMLLPKLW